MSKPVRCYKKRCTLDNGFTFDASSVNNGFGFPWPSNGVDCDGNSGAIRFDNYSFLTVYNEAGGLIGQAAVGSSWLYNQRTSWSLNASCI